MSHNKDGGRKSRSLRDVGREVTADQSAPTTGPVTWICMDKDMAGVARQGKPLLCSRLLTPSRCLQLFNMGTLRRQIVTSYEDYISVVLRGCHSQESPWDPAAEAVT